MPKYEAGDSSRLRSCSTFLLTEPGGNARPIKSQIATDADTPQRVDRGYIRWRSPLADALMKASPGDRVDLRAPAKTEHLEIIEVE